MSDAESGTYEEARAHARDWAKRELVNHVVTEKGPGEWYCGKPGTGCESFHVIARPGTLIFYGDIGDFVLHAYERNMLDWAHAAHSSPTYFCEKIQAGDREVFYQGDAEAFLAEALLDTNGGGETTTALAVAEEFGVPLDDLVPGTPEFTAEVKREIPGRLSDCSPERWSGAWYDAGDDEPSDHRAPTFRALVCMEALNWLWLQLEHQQRIAEEDAALDATVAREAA